MPNLHELENTMPVAPLKIIAMDSAAMLGNRVNDYLVDFRKQINLSLKYDPAFHAYATDNYLLDAKCPRLEVVKERVCCPNQSVVKMFLLL